MMVKARPPTYPFGGIDLKRHASQGSGGRKARK
jgi:hypothetical protein